MQKLMGDEGWGGGGGLFFSTDPKCLWFTLVAFGNDRCPKIECTFSKEKLVLTAKNLFNIER